MQLSKACKIEMLKKQTNKIKQNVPHKVTNKYYRLQVTNIC